MFSKYKEINSNRWGAITILTVMLYLSATDKLQLYIHPRYLLFTTIFVSLGLLILLFRVIVETFKKLPTISLLIIFISIIALLLPARSLSSQIASNRISETANPYGGVTSIEAFTTDLSRFNIRDWNALLASSPSATQIVGKKASFDGFVFSSNDVLYAARYQLTCCAVDATPLTVPLHPTTTSELRIGYWYRFEGAFTIAPDKTEDDRRYALSISQATPIEEPVPAYVY